jgi:hypothetical protein
MDAAAAAAAAAGDTAAGAEAFWLESLNTNATLPLDLAALAGRPGSVLLAGFTADDGDNLFGNYVQHTDRGGRNASILAGLARALGAPLPGPDGGAVAAAGPLAYHPACSDSACPATDLVLRAEAHAAAKVASVTVLVLGLTHNAKNNDDANGGKNVDSTHENEGHDRKTVALPPGQLALAAELSARRTGAPLVCVLVHGGSLAPATLMRDCDAIVPPRDSDPQGLFLGPRKYFAIVNPYGKYFLGHDNTPGGRNRARRRSSTCGTRGTWAGPRWPTCSSAKSRPPAAPPRPGTPRTRRCRNPASWRCGRPPPTAGARRRRDGRTDTTQSSRQSRSASGSATRSLGTQI